MRDFTSALYLGLRHSSHSLSGWHAFSHGRPAALEEPPGVEAIAATLAALQGCDAATLLPSTLHLFWDLFGVFSGTGTSIFMDAHTYPIVRWGVERAPLLGAHIQVFPHHQPHALRAQMARIGRSARPVVVTDGFCPACGRVAPIAAYSDIVRSRDGYLVVDDTQALGILGREPSRRMLYGTGGGGVLPWSGASGPHIIVGSSLAKGFGVPMAVLAGSRSVIRRFREHSLTRVHCSPPSVAAVRAAERALVVNWNRGDHLRERLLALVVRFRRGVERVGLTTVGGLFPVQTLGSIPDCESATLHRDLLRRGIRTVLHRARGAADGNVSFLITASHESEDIDRAVDALAASVSSRRGGFVAVEAGL